MLVAVKLVATGKTSQIFLNHKKDELDYGLSFRMIGGSVVAYIPNRPLAFNQLVL